MLVKERETLRVAESHLADFDPSGLHAGLLGDNKVLLRPNDAAGPAHSDVTQRLLGCKAVVLHQVAADEDPSPPQAGFAVDRKRPCNRA